MMGAVFAMQGIGQFAAGIMALIVVAGFKDSLTTAATVAQCDGVCGLAVDKMWRVIIGFGAVSIWYITILLGSVLTSFKVPGCVALYYRLTIPETPRYTFDVARDVVQAGSDVKAYITGARGGSPDEIAHARSLREEAPLLEIPKPSWNDFWAHYSQWRYGKVLLGTAGSWFFLDVSVTRANVHKP